MAGPTRGCVVSLSLGSSEEQPSRCICCVECCGCLLTGACFRRAPLPPCFFQCPSSNQLYNAHTVGCDALWAGVPMVTLRGAKMASRVGASLVEAAGMPELVTDSLEEYTELVVALAR